MKGAAMRGQWLTRAIGVLTLSVSVGIDLASAGKDDIDRWGARVRKRPQPAIYSEPPKLKIEELCIPVKATALFEAPDFVLNPDGTTWDLLRYYYKEYRGPHSTLIADLGTGDVTVGIELIPAGHLIHNAGRAVAPDGRYFIASGGAAGTRIFVYDPADNSLADTNMLVPDLPVSASLTVGTDGAIYGAGHDAKTSRARAFRIDVESGSITGLGHMGPESDYVMGIAADDEYCYLATRKSVWTVTAHNRQTGRETTLLSATPNGVIYLHQKRHGVEAQGNHLVGFADGQRHFFLHRGKIIEHADHVYDEMPWRDKDAEDAPRPMPPKPEIMAEKLTPGPNGSAELWYRFNENETWNKIPFQVPVYPISTHRLIALPDGRLWGNSEFYHGEFVYDPKTGESTHISRSGVSWSCGATQLDNKVYLAGYSSARLVVFDMNRPLSFRAPDVDRITLPEDQTLNPRHLAVLRACGNAHHVVAAAVGADGKIYFAGNSYRDTNRGALAWWDPRTETAGGIWEPFSNVAFSYMTPVAGGKYMVISTFPKPDTELGKPTPEQAKLMVFDVGKGEVVREIEPLTGAQWTGMVLGLDDRRVLGYTINPLDPNTWILYGVDVVTGRVAFGKITPNPEEQIRPRSAQAMGRYDLFRGPDGKVYTFMKHHLMRIDPEDGFVELLGYVGAPGDFAFIGKDLYIGGLPVLRRIRNVTALRGTR
jgi:hypothetical protein